MVRKKSKAKGFQLRPFCYYCDREFDDESTLVQHQRAKHFKCEVCHKKLTTARSLRTHSVQVHKLDLKIVPHAKPERSGIDPDIVGMTWVPEYLLEAKAEKRDLDETMRIHKKSQHTKSDANLSLGSSHLFYDLGSSLPSHSRLPPTSGMLTGPMAAFHYGGPQLGGCGATTVKHISTRLDMAPLPDTSRCHTEYLGICGCPARADIFDPYSPRCSTTIAPPSLSGYEKPLNTNPSAARRGAVISSGPKFSTTHFSLQNGFGRTKS